MASELPEPKPGQMIGQCEAEDVDAPDKLLDAYMFRGESPRDDGFRWLCEEHRP